MQIGNVPSINEIKDCLEEMKQNKWIIEWQLPYENVLTKKEAAIFYFAPASEVYLDAIWNKLKKYGVSPKYEKADKADNILSDLPYYFMLSNEM